MFSFAFHPSRLLPSNKETQPEDASLPAFDNEWFDYHIIVRDKHIVVKINGETIADYTEPDNLDRKDRKLSSGTFALQAHDPGSKVHYRNLRVKVLP